MSDPRIPDSKDVYRTTDFKIAAFLKTKHANHIASERDLAGRVTFVFEDHVRCEDLVSEVYGGIVNVCLPDYWAAERSLRIIINQGQPKRESGRER